MGSAYNGGGRERDVDGREEKGVWMGGRRKGCRWEGGERGSDGREEKRVAMGGRGKGCG